MNESGLSVCLVTSFQTSFQSVWLLHFSLSVCLLSVCLLDLMWKSYKNMRKANRFQFPIQTFQECQSDSAGESHSVQTDRQTAIQADRKTNETAAVLRDKQVFKVHFCIFVQLMQPFSEQNNL